MSIYKNVVKYESRKKKKRKSISDVKQNQIKAF